MTCSRSSLRSTVFTTPISTSRYLIGEVPGWRPCADWKVRVIVGPLRDQAVYASQAPIAAASNGITQMSGRPRRRSTTTCDTSSVMIRSCRVPQETRVERHGGEHGDHHDPREGDGARAWLDGGQGAELDECGADRQREDVDHRPAADA